MTQKTELRAYYRTLRAALSPQRRKAAADALVRLIPNEGWVLSFSSFNHEIETQDLNRLLARNGQLVLPLCQDRTLELYCVTDIDQQTQKGKLGFSEPIPHKCERIDSNLLTLALIPGLAFDPKGHRLGYGMGYYDRLIHSSLKTIGIGFCEQQHPTPLPIDPWDQPLHQIYLT